MGLGLCDMGNVPRHVVSFNVKLFNRKRWTWEIQKKGKTALETQKLAARHDFAVLCLDTVLSPLSLLRMR